MQRYPFLCLTLILICSLCLPFILRLKDTRLEVYPAILFPSGASLVETEAEVFKIYSIDLYGFKDGLVKINKSKFLYPIPVQNLFTIQQGDFGLKNYTNEFKLYKPPIKFRISNNASLSAIQETKKWYQKKLKEQRLQDSAFIVREYLIVIDIENKIVKNKEIISEEIFNLD